MAIYIPDVQISVAVYPLPASDEFCHECCNVRIRNTDAVEPDARLYVCIGRYDASLVADCIHKWVTCIPTFMLMAKLTNNQIDSLSELAHGSGIDLN